MNPQNVNPKNFEVDQILFNNGEFSIAFGTWQKRTKNIAMRWNGNENGDVGYPKVFGNPMWFIVDLNIQNPLLQSLIGLNGADNELIIKLLDEFKKSIKVID